MVKIVVYSSCIVTSVSQKNPYRFNIELRSYFTLIEVSISFTLSGT